MARTNRLDLNRILQNYDFKGSKSLQNAAYRAAIKKAKETFYQKIGINFSAIRKESSFSTSLQKIEKK